MTTSPGEGERDDIDARFADIVARWDDPPVDDARPSCRRDDPAGSDGALHDGPLQAPDRPGRGLPGGDDAGTRGTGVPPTPGVRPAPRTFGGPPPSHDHLPPEDDEEEGFEPLPTSPLPPFLTDWSFYLALFGLVGGPLWLLYLALFANTERHQMWMAGALTLAGFVTLVLRQPHERDEDDHDDGARV